MEFPNHFPSSPIFLYSLNLLTSFHSYFLTFSQVTDSDNSSRDLVKGAHVRNRLTGEEWDIRAKVVINATGPFSDTIRHMDDPTAPNIVQPSAGIHIILPSYYSPRTMGLLDPATSDGRVIFFLPWQGNSCFV